MVPSGSMWFQGDPRGSNYTVSHTAYTGLSAPACVLARRASRRRDEGAGPKGPRRRRLGCRPKAGKLVMFIVIATAKFSKIALDILVVVAAILVYQNERFLNYK